MNHIVSINWTQQALTGEQLVLLRNIAAMLLKRADKPEQVDFTHLLLEGRITNKGTGVFVTIPGTFFHADLGSHGGEKWTIDFLLPRGSERFVLDDYSMVTTTTVTRKGVGKSLPVDHVVAEATEDSILVSR